MRSRVRGCLLGGALGDAIGRPIEFSSLAAIRAAFGTDGLREPKLTDQGWLEISDDTQMTLFTAEGVLRSTTRHVESAAQRDATSGRWTGRHSPDASVMRNAYLRWLATQKRDYCGKSGPSSLMPPGGPGWLIGVEHLYWRRAAGRTCLSALESSTSGSVESPINDSKGCGGVMRVAPIGLVQSEDPFAYGVMAAAITHGHPSGYLSAGAYAHIIHHLLFTSEGAAPRESLHAAVDSAMTRLRVERAHEETSRALERALEFAAREGGPSAERVEELGAGWVGEEALALGVYCALAGRDFAESVLLAMNHSGDSDSTASIAGGIAGVQCGEVGLPREWLARLDLREVITAVADDLVTGYRDDAEWRQRYPGD